MERRLKSPADIEARCAELGFLPFFRCGIPGFSVEEMVAPEYWFTDEEGAWEWKGPVIREGHCAYGKLFARKAGFVSREWLPDLTNYRRSRSLAPNEDTAALDDVVLQTVLVEGTATIKELRQMLGFLTRLQMKMRLVIADFEYNVDRRGNRYGWGIARYTAPETLYDPLRVERTPTESFERIYEHLRRLFPNTTESKLLKLIG